MAAVSRRTGREGVGQPAVRPRRPGVRGSTAGPARQRRYFLLVFSVCEALVSLPLADEPLLPLPDED